MRPKALEPTEGGGLVAAAIPIPNVRALPPFRLVLTRKLVLQIMALAGQLKLTPSQVIPFLINEKFMSFVPTNAKLEAPEGKVQT